MRGEVQGLPCGRGAALGMRAEHFWRQFDEIVAESGKQARANCRRKAWRQPGRRNKPAAAPVGSFFAEKGAAGLPRAAFFAAGCRS